MAKRVVWISNAERIFSGILRYYVQRNGTKTYSRNLNLEISKLVDLLSNYPFLGKITTKLNTRVLIKGNYKIFYKIFPERLVIVIVWDTRQNPNGLKDFLF